MNEYLYYCTVGKECLLMDFYFLCIHVVLRCLFLMNTDICNIAIKFFIKSLFTIVIKIKITVLHFYF